MWKDFKAFAMRGNVMDLAVAVVIGAAFGKIVTSLVENIVTPLIGLITGGIDFTEKWKIGLGDAQIQLGMFVQSILDFVIIAFAIFMALRLLNKFNRKQEIIEKEAAAPVIDSKEELLKEIRDLLKKEQA